MFGSRNSDLLGGLIISTRLQHDASEYWHPSDGSSSFTTARKCHRVDSSPCPPMPNETGKEGKSSKEGSSTGPMCSRTQRYRPDGPTHSGP